MTREATGKSPFHLVYGASAVIPTEMEIETHRLLHFDDERNEALLLENLDMVEEEREITHLRAETYKSRVNVAYNRKGTLRKCEVGDLVLRRVDALKNICKLGTNWEGPYKVIQALKGGAYRLQDMEGKQIARPWNICNLMRFFV